MGGVSFFASGGSPKAPSIKLRVNPDDNGGHASPESQPMFSLLETLTRLLSSLSKRPDADERYLAEATDGCDLERRLRKLEVHDRPADSGVTFGLYPR